MKPKKAEAGVGLPTVSTATSRQGDVAFVCNFSNLKAGKVFWIIS